MTKQNVINTVGTIIYVTLICLSFNPFFWLIITVVWYATIGHYFLERFLVKFYRFIDFSRATADEVFEPEIATLVQSKKIDEALEKCRGWIRHQPNSAAPILRKTQIMIDYQHETNRVIQELEMAVSRAFPAEDHVSLAIYLAELYRRSGRDTEVEPLYRRIRLLHSRSPEVSKLV
jgi:hypothetical protein